MEQDERVQVTLADEPIDLNKFRFRTKPINMSHPFGLHVSSWPRRGGAQALASLSNNGTMRTSSTHRKLVSSANLKRAMSSSKPTDVSALDGFDSGTESATTTTRPSTKRQKQRTTADKDTQAAIASQSSSKRNKPRKSVQQALQVAPGMPSPYVILPEKKAAQVQMQQAQAAMQAQKEAQAQLMASKQSSSTTTSTLPATTAAAAAAESATTAVATVGDAPLMKQDTKSGVGNGPRAATPTASSLTSTRMEPSVSADSFKLKLVNKAGSVTASDSSPPPPPQQQQTRKRERKEPRQPTPPLDTDERQFKPGIPVLAKFPNYSWWIAVPLKPSSAPPWTQGKLALTTTTSNDEPETRPYLVKSVPTGGDHRWALPNEVKPLDQEVIDTILNEQYKDTPPKSWVRWRDELLEAIAIVTDKQR
ncbi:hypothetical protein OIO90_006417 [Microbotryomycetes sp. JL221]|nr:hypothetical protein OIO90_006417 [Microbotryomycetes sp. JL221]